MSPLWWVRLLRIGDRGPDVKAVQQLVGLPVTGEYDYDTALTVRGLQLLSKYAATGEVDEQTSILLGARSNDDLPPEWWQDQPLHPGDVGYPAIGEDAVRRVQGQYGITPTGVVDQQTALILGAIGVEHAVY